MSEMIEGIEIMTFGELKKLLSKSAYKDLMGWMKGQTCLEKGIYMWDFDRWIRNKEPIW